MVWRNKSIELFLTIVSATLAPLRIDRNILCELELGISQFADQGFDFSAEEVALFGELKQADKGSCDGYYCYRRRLRWKPTKPTTARAESTRVDGSGTGLSVNDAEAAPEISDHPSLPSVLTFRPL